MKVIAFNIGEDATYISKLFGRLTTGMGKAKNVRRKLREIEMRESDALAARRIPSETI